MIREAMESDAARIAEIEADGNSLSVMLKTVFPILTFAVSEELP